MGGGPSIFRFCRGASRCGIVARGMQASDASIKARLEQVKLEKKLVEKEREIVEQVVVDLRRSRGELLSPRSGESGQAAAVPRLVSPRSADSLLSSPRGASSASGVPPSPRSAPPAVGSTSPKTPTRAAGAASPRGSASSSQRNSKSLSHLPQELRESRELMIVSPRGQNAKALSPRSGGSQTRPVVPKLTSPSPLPAVAALQSPKSPTASMSPRSLVEPVIREILKTEEAYLRDLQLVGLHYREPSRIILTAEDVDTLFANLDGLVALHRVFLAELSEEAKKPLNAQNWGLVFRSHVGQFRREYQAYTKNQGRARARRIALEHGHERFKALIAAALKHPDIK